jgi:hypothetical protein
MKTRPVKSKTEGVLGATMPSPSLAGEGKEEKGLSCDVGLGKQSNHLEMILMDGHAQSYSARFRSIHVSQNRVEAKVVQKTHRRQTTESQKMAKSRKSDGKLVKSSGSWQQ